MGAEASETIERTEALSFCGNIESVMVWLTEQVEDEGKQRLLARAIQPFLLENSKRVLVKIEEDGTVILSFGDVTCTVDFSASLGQEISYQTEGRVLDPLQVTHWGSAAADRIPSKPLPSGEAGEGDIAFAFLRVWRVLTQGQAALAVVADVPAPPVAVEDGELVGV